MATSTAIFLNLAVYFLINLSLSTCNKLVLEKISTPWLLTCLHSTITSIGCFVYLQRQKPVQKRKLSAQEHVTLLCFSCLFTINIAMSNISLSHVSLAFHQVARSTSPIFTVIIYGVWFGKVYHVPVYVSVVATSIGIGLATYGDYTCTVIGFWLTFLGMVLATIKTIATNRLMTGNLKLDPFEALLRLCPLAAAQSLLCAYVSGELEVAKTLLRQGSVSRSTLYLVVVNGLLAFAQNLSSFYTNKMAGALTIAVAANLKQACTIVLAIRIFETQVSLFSALGIIVVLSSTSYYSWTIVRRRNEDEENVRIAASRGRRVSWEDKSTKQ